MTTMGSSKGVGSLMAVAQGNCCAHALDAQPCDSTCNPISLALAASAKYLQAAPLGLIV